MQKHIVIPPSSSILSTIVNTSVVCQHLVVHNHSKPDSVHKALINSGARARGEMKQYKTVDSNWPNNINLPKKYEGYWKDFLGVLKTFQGM